ncbi:MAG TPA: hypothetical protein VF692_01935 [Pyrinomonadaceae bacterium]
MVAIFLFVSGGLFSFGCQPNAAILESAKNSTARANSQAEPAARSFERDLETMRTANFDYIYVFRRKDGAPLDADDKKYVKLNSPVETNRFILSDEEKAVVAGSKYKFAEQNLMALRDRFNIEDFSKPQLDAPPSPPAAAENANR